MWELARQQHGVVSRAQLLALGFSAQAIKHRVRRGRLHPVARGVYAVGRCELTRDGRWMAAVLTCGPTAVLSHGSAAALWRIGPEWRLEVSIPHPLDRRRPGVVIHRRSWLRATEHRGIPVTPVVDTLVDLAAALGDDPVEAAINEADKRDLCDPERLRHELDDLPAWTGIKNLRRILDLRTFTMTDWPELKLVVETDGLRYHRTPAQQARDLVRDQVHSAAGLRPLRFTRAQVRYEPAHVERILTAVGRGKGP